MSDEVRKFADCLSEELEEMARQDELAGHEGQHSAEILRTVAMAVQEAAKKSEGPYLA